MFWNYKTIRYILQTSVKVLVSWIMRMPNVYKVEGKAIKNILGILSKVFRKWISFQHNFKRSKPSLLWRKVGTKHQS